MTAVSLISPYAPQPVGNASAEQALGGSQMTLPVADAGGARGSGLASDQSGQGAGNGTGTGGAQLTTLLRKGREGMPVQRPTPESVVEAQSESDPATEFLERQARQQAQAKAAEEERQARIAEARANEAKDEADRAAEPAYVMPNPLPTAPILERDP
jgi:hypothetical protein